MLACCCTWRRFSIWGMQWHRKGFGNKCWQRPTVSMRAEECNSQFSVQVIPDANAQNKVHRTDERTGRDKQNATYDVMRDYFNNRRNIFVACILFNRAAKTKLAH